MLGQLFASMLLMCSTGALLLLIGGVQEASSSSPTTTLSHRTTYLMNVGGLNTFNTTEAVAPNVVPNGDVLLLTTWFGAYPCIVQPNNEFCNGGIPQLCNYTAHETAMRQDLFGYLKTPQSYSGVVVVDYEAWVPIWNVTGEVYRNASMVLAASELPSGASPSEIAAKAKQDYEAAAMQFLIFTASTLRAWLPQAAGVGFYGYPTTYGFWNSNVSQTQAWNNQLMPLWTNLTVLLPSLYLPYVSDVDVPYLRNVQWIGQQVNESVRIAELVTKEQQRRPFSSSSAPPAPPLVVPYTWYRYHPGEPHGYELLTAQDAALEFDYPAKVSGGVVQSMIIWGDETGPQGPDANVTAAEDWLQQHRNVFAVGSAAATSSRMIGRRHDRTDALSGMMTLPPWKRCSL